MARHLRRKPRYSMFATLFFNFLVLIISVFEFAIFFFFFIEGGNENVFLDNLKIQF